MKDESNQFQIFRSIYYIPLLKRIYIGHFHLSFFSFPVLIFFQFFIFFFVLRFIIPYTPKSPNSTIEIALSFIFNFLFLLLICISTFEGPGYLPFDYFIDKNESYENSHNSLGIAINDKDCAAINSYLNGTISFDYSPSLFFMYQEPPFLTRNIPKCTNFIPSERRFIINPIVFDILTGTWVGQRNAKLFIQAKLYSIFSSLFLFRPYFASLHNFIHDYSFGYDFSLSLFLFVFLLVRICLQSIICLMVINKMAFSTIVFNQETNIDNLGDAYKRLKTFLGPHLISWFLPIPTFYKLSNDEVYHFAQLNEL